MKNKAETLDRLDRAEQPLTDDEAKYWKPAIEVRELLRRRVKFYSKKEVAEQLSCTVKTVERYMRDSKLTFFRRGIKGGVLIPETSITAFLLQLEIDTLFPNDTAETCKK